MLMLHTADLDRLVEERQARLRAERRPTVAGPSLRRRIGRTLISAGAAIAGEPAEQAARPTHLRPARPPAS